MTIKTPTPEEREAVLICALAACQSMLKTCQRMLATSIAEASQLETDVAALRAELAEARGPGPAAIYSATPDAADHTVAAYAARARAGESFSVTTSTAAQADALARQLRTIGVVAYGSGHHGIGGGSSVIVEGQAAALPGAAAYAARAAEAPDDAEHGVTLADALPAAPPCRACSGERGRFENGPGHTDYWAGCDVCAGSGVCPLTE